MNTLNIDFRDGCLRVLVMKDRTVQSSKTVKDFRASDTEQASQQLMAVLREAGVRKGRVNVILPSDIVRHRVFQIPSMDLADARKVVGRELSKDLKGQEFVLGIRRIVKGTRTGGGRQHILAEFAGRAEVMRYLQIIRKSGLKPDCVTSSLEGNAAMFNRFRPETDGNEAVVDIGSNVMEIAVFNSGHFVGYEQLPISIGTDETADAKEQSPGQSDKMKVYTIVDTLYKFILGTGQEQPEERISSFWLCGINSVIDGIDASVADGLGMSAKVIAPFDAAVDKGSSFSALYGISGLSASGLTVNLIPENLLDAKTRLARRIILAASLAFYVIMIGGSYAILNQTEKDLRLQLDSIQKTVQTMSPAGTTSGDRLASGRETLMKMVSESRPLYPVFRDLASLTPAGVVFDSLQIEKAQGGHTVKIGTTIRYSDESFRKALISGFLDSLETSSTLRMKSSPEISTPRPAGKEKTISVTALYEVIE